MWYCKSCGARNSDNYNYCSNCGQKKQAATDNEENTTGHASKINVIRNILIVFVSLVMLAAIALIYISKQRDFFYDDGILRVQYKSNTLEMEIKGINIEDNYILDQSESVKNQSEYIWQISFSDKQNSYELGTLYFCKTPGDNRVGTIDEMDHSLWILDSSDESYVQVENASITHTKSSITWTVRVPETYDIRFDQVAYFEFHSQGKSSLHVNCSKVDRITDITSASIGKTIDFGSYEQDNMQSDGKERISWIILEVEQGRALLMSVYGLDYLPFNDHWDSNITWENSTLRAWLNSDFIDNSFSGDEQKRILSVSIKNGSPTMTQRETTDRVFLLSQEEFESLHLSDYQRSCMPSQLAISKGPYNYYDLYEYWLRTPGESSALFLCVHNYLDPTFLDSYYSSMYAESKYLVRPCIWVNVK